MRQTKAQSAELADFEVSSEPFYEMVEFFKQKVNMPTKSWAELLNQAHDRSFMVAGAMRDDLLSDFKGAIDKAITNGTSLEVFRDDFASIVKKHGWSYKGEFGWRTKVIYETNLRTAYQAGRLKQMRDPEIVKQRPYWQYIHGETRKPKNPRAQHLAWNGMVLAHDDPFWQTHYPPNDWGCSCGVDTLSQADLKRLGKSKPDKSPKLRMRRVKDPVTGDKLDIPQGVGLGFAYQPGNSWQQGLVPKELQKPLAAFASDKRAIAGKMATGFPSVIASTKIMKQSNLTPLSDIAKPFKSSVLPKDKDNEFYADKFLSKFGAAIGSAKIFRDKAGQAVLVCDDLFKTADNKWKIKKRGREIYMEHLAETIIDPDEIWVNWVEKQGKVILDRRYLRYDPEAGIIISYEWSNEGWSGVTAFSPQKKGKINTTSINQIEARRNGALLYRRK